ncbi:uncharacterized protein TNCV_4236031 [Trichonephila clavipes]|nr:uncharacterized protein TNCV_4236031 [Trichonephila clavipes]
MPLTQWPPKIPDLTLADFFLCKGQVFVPPLPVDLAELKQRITTIIDGLDSCTLTCVSVKIDYRLNVCRATKGSHIEHICDCL